MTVALIGGLDRLAPHYTAIADEHEGLTIKVFSRFRPGLSDRIASADGVILCTDLVSHKAAREVYRLARANDVELVCTHRSSVSAVRRSVAELARVCRCDRPCPGCPGACGCEGARKRR
ncbi:MAG: DUF2325 domain-containing protein [Clostridiales bacterium]|nr:DUF2325 domain-containing protein [Clostridiales bacterium]